MTDVIAPPGELHVPPVGPGDGHGAHLDHGERHGPHGILKWLTSTDHKVIGMSYTITAVATLLIGGALALVMRTQLASPHSSLLSFSQFNALFTMHGTIMLLLFAGPFAFGGLANYIVPLQVGAPDMAFPRLNALSYWLYLTGAICLFMSFFVAGGAAQFGWVAYAPLNSATSSPGAGPDLWIVALMLTGFSAIFTGVNLCATIFYLRAPGMTMFRMPIFTWNMLVVAILILIAFPVFTAALVMLFCDRHFNTHIYTAIGCHFVNGLPMHSCGSPLLWQNLFWFFGHPEVYILALPFFGIVTEILPVFSRKPVFGYKGMVFATMAIAALSTGVWAHHMFTTGAVLLPFFSILSLLIAVPT
ncbi:MAG TPA: cbb3-type cytochrome c oxidase subunit I, partial [Candidatus Methylomirabilis sp.]|nr:cbb3-type cytochrome c oxidase subunit I [Candidatus Methylomirabilis sp.]